MAQQMKKLKVLAIISLSILLFSLIFQNQISTHLKIITFISEQFPQIPIKPLKIITAEPTHQKVELESPNGKIVGDLFFPSNTNRGKGAIILAMGVRTQEKDKPLLFSLAKTLARLGYVVFWPRLESLDKGAILPEEPETFVASFKYLEKQAAVDPKRISFIGFSVGSSTAFVASSDDQISERVHSLIFFGGYFNIYEYFASLATKKAEFDGEIIEWEGAEDAINHAKSLIEAKEARNLLQNFKELDYSKFLENTKNLPQSERDIFDEYDPSANLNNFQTEIFILHDKSDTYVPYQQSIKLSRALKEEQFLIINLFEHVQPKKGVSLEIIGEFLKLYQFLYSVLIYL